MPRKGKSRGNKRPRVKATGGPKNLQSSPDWMITGAAAIFDPHGERHYRDRRLGSFGSASPVRQIDPSSVPSEAIKTWLTTISE